MSKMTKEQNTYMIYLTSSDNFISENLQIFQQASEINKPRNSRISGIPEISGNSGISKSP